MDGFMSKLLFGIPVYLRRIILTVTVASACAEALSAALPPTAVPQSIEVHPSTLLVGFRARPSLQARASLHTAMGTRRLHSMHRIPLDVVALPPHADRAQIMASYRHSREVAYVEPNYKVYASMTPNDPQFTNLWGLLNTGAGGGTPGIDIGATNAWTLSTGDSNVIVAIIDTGIDYSHPDLASNMWINTAEALGITGEDDDNNGIIDDIHGARWTDGTGTATSGDPDDDHYHGTHVAGTIGAIGNNGHAVVGVNWTVRLMALKFLNSQGSGYIADAVSALEYALDKGIPVSNNSWGGGGFSQAMSDMLSTAEEQGHLFIAAAGNSGTDNDRNPHYPSSYIHENVLAVAAGDRCDRNASFTCYGLTSVDIAAPGVDILSTVPGEGLNTLNGTSMATPHVSGAAALLLALNPSASWRQLKDWIMGGAIRSSSWQGLTVTGGRLHLAEPCRYALLPDHVGPATTLTAESVQGENTVTLCWSNPTNTGFEEVVIRRDTQEFPRHWQDGDPVYAGHGETATDGPLTRGCYACYTLWAYYSNGCYSAPVHTRCRVGGYPSDSFTELFSDNLDLSNHTLTLLPDGSANYYQAFTDPAYEFPTDPSGGIPLAMSLDESIPIVLTNEAQLCFFGMTYTSLFAGANGYITFNSADNSSAESLTTHFRLPRISALFDRLDPSPSNCVSWKQCSNGIAVTWQDISEYGDNNANSFQIELFEDGMIRITWLELAAQDGLAGLSDGEGLPPEFIESDLVAYPPFDDLRIQPRTPLAYTGYEGGGFSPVAGVLTFTNAGASNLSWTAAQDGTWLDILPAAGTLPPGCSVTVTVQVKSIADTFDIGVYRDTLIISNEVSTCAQSIPVSLYVQREGRRALIHADVYTGRNSVREALQTLGYAVTQASSWDDFNQQLSVTNYSLVVALSHELAPGIDESRLTDYLDEGGRCILADMSRRSTLAQRLEAEYTTTYNPNPVTITDPELVEGVSMPFALTSQGRSVMSIGLSTDGDAESLAQFPGGESAVVWGNNGHSALLGFCADSMTAEDGLPFFQNLVSMLLHGSDPLRIAPPDPFNSAGYEAAVPHPNTMVYTLTNAGTTSLSWTAGTVADWATVDPSTGQLAAGGTTSIALALSTNIGTWSSGEYTNCLVVSNAVTGRFRTRPIHVDLRPLPGKLVIMDSVPPTNDHKIMFEECFVGQSSAEQITLHNIDTQYPLIIEGVYVEGFDVPEASEEGPPQGSSEWLRTSEPPTVPVIPMHPGVDTNAPEYVPDQLLIGFKSERARQMGAQVHAAVGTRRIHAFHTIPVDVVELPPGADIAEYAVIYRQQPQVAYAEPNYKFRTTACPDDPDFDQLWAMENTGQQDGVPGADIQAVPAWDVTQGSRDIIVAVIDTGIDYTHPDLVENIWVNEAEWAGTPDVDDDGNGIADDIYGARWTGRYGAPTSGNPMDDNGHGTHVAGTIGAVGNNGIGVAGVNWNVRLMALKFLNYSGNGYVADALSAIEYALDKGAHLSNNSWGGGYYSQSLRDIIAAAAEANQLFVTSAGNKGGDNDLSPLYPACYPVDNIVSVAACDRFDERASFSCYGRSSVDIAAPGVDILSTCLSESYTLKSGTSMAAPHVSGLAALLLSVRPGSTYAQLKQMILDGAEPLPAWTDYIVTGGRLNAWRSLSMVNPNFRTGAQHYPVHISPGESLTVDAFFTPFESGIHTCRLFIVSNDSNTPMAVVKLEGSALNEHLEVSPAEMAELTGESGGPFSPEQLDYTLSNTGPDLLNWTASVNVPWLDLSADTGCLTAETSRTVSLLLDEQVDELAWGTYGATALFSNGVSGLVHERRIRLNIAMRLCDALDQCGWTWSNDTYYTWTGVTSPAHDGRDSARSASPPKGRSSSLSTTLRGPGILSFWWQSGHSSFFGDCLEIYLDGTLIQGGMYATAWEYKEITIPNGMHTVKWRYKKNWGWSSPPGYDQARLDEVSFFSTELEVRPDERLVASGPPGGPFAPASTIYTLTNGGLTTLTWTASANAPWLSLSAAGGTLLPGEFTNLTVELNENANTNTTGYYYGTVIVENVTRGYTRPRTVVLAVEQPLCEAFEACELNWQRGGTGFWFWQTNTSRDGMDAAQSAAITNGQTCWMETAIEGPKDFSFWYKVSSNVSSHALSFRIDGVEQAMYKRTWWEDAVVSIPNGMHTLRWTYVNNGLPEGKAWVDEISYVSTALGVTPENGFHPRGRPTGPFVPAAGIYILTNRSLEALEWDVMNTAGWADVAPTNGILAAGETISVTVTPNEVTATLDYGSYSGTLLFSNRMDGQAYARPLSLVLEEPVCEAVDNCALQWSRSGDAFWYYQTDASYDGVDAAHSGTIGINSSTKLTVTVEGPGELSFRVLFSEWGPFGYSGKLYIRQDGIVLETIENNVSWRLTTLDIPAGVHTVDWNLVSGYQYYPGGGYAMLDEVAFVPAYTSAIPEWWLTRYNLPIDGSVDYEDSDGDGHDNWKEWRAGTDPTNSQSVLRCRFIQHPVAGHDIVISWPSITDRTYCLQYSTGLLNYTTIVLTTNLAGRVNSTCYTDTVFNATHCRFYRVIVE
jgi:subtilisin family serine protease